MSNTSKNIWETLESHRSTYFLVAVLMLSFFLSILFVDISEGNYESSSYGVLLNVFLGVAWAAIFLGVLGFHSSLSNNSGWTLRIGTSFSVIGLVTSLVMVVLMLGTYVELLSDTSAYTNYFIIPGYTSSIPLGCGLYGISIFKSKEYTWMTGLLVILLPATFLTNVTTRWVFGYQTVVKTAVVVSVLIVINISIAYILASGGAKSAAN